MNGSHLNEGLIIPHHQRLIPAHTLLFQYVCLSNRKKEVVESNNLWPHQNCQTACLIVTSMDPRMLTDTHTHACNQDLTHVHTRF